MPTTYEYLESGGQIIKVIPRIITDCGTKSFDEFNVTLDTIVGQIITNALLTEDGLHYMSSEDGVNYLKQE